MNLKELRSKLQFGDIKIIATEIGVSTATVQAALRGTITTNTAQMVVDHAEHLIKLREDRIEYLQRVIKPKYAKP